MRLKANLMDESQMRRTLIRISHEIIEKNRDVSNIFLVGIQRRGLSLAKEIAQVIKTVSGENVPIGAIDITLYRDDFSLISTLPIIKSTDLPFQVTDANIILIDDVLYTGRTIRAAMEALTEHGRPKTIQLAVLIDRGSRELPIGANYIGKTIECLKDELVCVNVSDIDGANQVDIYSLD